MGGQYNIIALGNVTYHASARIFEAQPNTGPSDQFAPWTLFRRCPMRKAMGMPYETAKAMTPTEMKALKADVDPKLISPSSNCIRVTSATARTGMPRRSSTLDQTEDRGTALSRAKAQVVREAATVIEMDAKKVMMRISTVNPAAAA